MIINCYNNVKEGRSVLDDLLFTCFTKDLQIEQKINKLRCFKNYILCAGKRDGSTKRKWEFQIQKREIFMICMCVCVTIK